MVGWPVAIRPVVIAAGRRGGGSGWGRLPVGLGRAGAGGGTSGGAIRARTRVRWMVLILDKAEPEGRR